MTETLSTEQRRRRRFRRAQNGAIGVGIAGMLVGVPLGYELAAAVIYLVGVFVGSAVYAWARFGTDVLLYDERERRIERYASGYTVTIVAWAGVTTFPVLFVLEAAGRIEFDPVLVGAMYAIAGQFLLWGVIYGYLRFRP